MMKKKILSFALAFCLIVPCMFMLSACGEHEHTFETTWSMNETHHWHASTCEHSEEKADYAEHVDENEDNICDVCKHGQVATIGEVGYTSLQAAVDAAGAADTVVLFSDVVLETKLTISNVVTINLNGHNISRSAESMSTQTILVVAEGDLTIEGNGEVNGAGASDYNIAIWAYGGNVTINGGTYTNVADNGIEGSEVLYVSNSGSITINNGTFISETPDWTLNKLDSDNVISDMIVKGGRFYNYNPEEGITENPHQNFVDDGYTVVQDGDYYTVVEAE